MLEGQLLMMVDGTDLLVALFCLVLFVLGVWKAVELVLAAVRYVPLF